MASSNSYNSNQKAFDTEQDLRRRAVEAAKEQAKLADQSVRVLEESGVQGLNDLRRQAAIAMANRAGGLGARGQSGGGLAGSLSQAALDNGAALSRQRAANEAQTQAARQLAAQARLDALKFEKEAGDLDQDRLKDKQAAILQIETYRSQYGANSAKFKRMVQALADSTADPYIQAYILQQANLGTAADQADATSAFGRVGRPTFSGF